MDSKPCSQCGETKLLTSFSTRLDRKSGRRSECKSCQWKMQSRRKRGQAIPVEKYRAYSTLRYAVKVGRLIKPSHCELCGEDVNVHAHRADYSRPLDVNWLCVPCHNALHRAQISPRALISPLAADCTHIPLNRCGAVCAL